MPFVTFLSRLLAGHFEDEAGTQKVMSQKCIENMYVRTIFLQHKNLDFTEIARLSHNFQFLRRPIHAVGYGFLFCRMAHDHATEFTHFLRRADVDFDHLQRADIGFECY
jgi:hypothetical protein